MRSDLFRVVTGHKPGNRICDVCGCTSGATWDSRMTLGFRWKPSPQPSNSYADPTVTAFERGSRWRPHLRNPWPPGLSPGVLGSGTRRELTGRAPRAGGARGGEQRRGLQLPRTRYTNNERATTGSARLRRLPICDVFLFIIGFLSSYRKTRGKYRETHLPLSLSP